VIEEVAVHSECPWSHGAACQVTAYMEHLTSDLESAAHPALDAIISKVRFPLPPVAAHCCRLLLHPRGLEAGTVAWSEQ
jgi:hypothetical protein